MNTMANKDIVVFHPGYYIAEIIEDIGVTQAEFAMRLGVTNEILDKLMNGQINLSNEIAERLAKVFGTSADVWLNLQSTYNQTLRDRLNELER